MSLYRRISIRMWGDAKFLALSAPQPNARDLWIYLLTGEQTTAIPGVIRAGEAALAEALGWPLAAFRKAFLEISLRGMAKADWTARLVFLPKALFHNPPQSPKVVVAWRKTFEELPDCELRNEIGRSVKAYLEEKQIAFRIAFEITIPEAKANTESESETEDRNRSFEGFNPSTKPKKLDPDEAWFHEVYTPAFPAHRRVQQVDALRELKKLKLDEVGRAAILVRLEKWKLSDEWTKDDGNFIPGMATFLQDSKYRTEPRSNGKKPSSTYQTADDYYRGAKAS